MRFEASEEWQAVREILPRKTGSAIDIGAGAVSAVMRWQGRVASHSARTGPQSIVGREAIHSLCRARQPSYPSSEWICRKNPVC